MKYTIQDIQPDWVYVQFTDESDDSWVFSTSVPINTVTATDEQITAAIGGARADAEARFAAYTTHKHTLEAMRMRLVGTAGDVAALPLPAPVDPAALQPLNTAAPIRMDAPADFNPGASLATGVHTF